MRKRLRELARAHPRIVAFLMLAAGMLIVLFFTAGDTPLTAGQFASVIAATVVLAALCIWIIGWE